MSFVNPNPNEPNYPYGGGTDNPGDDTSKAGGPVDYASTETGAPPTAVRHPPVVAGVAQAGTDTLLPAGVQAVPPTNDGLEATSDIGADPSGGVTFNADGTVRVAGQDEVAGETETTSGVTPSAFPEPNP